MQKQLCILKEGSRQRSWRGVRRPLFFLPILEVATRRHCPQNLKIRASGSITFFAWVWSQKPVLGGSLITAMNSAIGGVGRALAMDLAPIQVNTVSPGITDTPIHTGPYWNAAG